MLPEVREELCSFYNFKDHLKKKMYQNIVVHQLFKFPNSAGFSQAKTSYVYSQLQYVTWSVGEIQN